MRRFGSATVTMMLVGFLAVAASIWQGVANWRFLGQAVRVEGRVIDATTPSRPFVAFETAHGETVRFRTDGFFSGAVGEPAPVTYLAANPAGTARINTFWTLWSRPLWGLPMGLGFMLAPFFGFRGRWRFGR